MTQAEKPCQLITVVPPPLHEEWAERFTGLISGFRPAGIIVQGSPSRHSLKLIAAAHAHVLAVLVEDDIESGGRVEADGVHLSAFHTHVPAARLAMGASAIIGATCPLTRHEAMVAAEAGADYIAFPFSDEMAGKALDLTSWWSEVTEIPVALWCGASMPCRQVRIASAADFIILADERQAGESLGLAREYGLISEPHD